MPNFYFLTDKIPSSYHDGSFLFYSIAPLKIISLPSSADVQFELAFVKLNDFGFFNVRKFH